MKRLIKNEEITYHRKSCSFQNHFSQLSGKMIMKQEVSQWSENENINVKYVGDIITITFTHHSIIITQRC